MDQWNWMMSCSLLNPSSASFPRFEHKVNKPAIGRAYHYYATRALTIIVVVAYKTRLALHSSQV